MRGLRTSGGAEDASAQILTPWARGWRGAVALLRMILMFCTVFKNCHREGHVQTNPLCILSCPTGSRIAAPYLGMVLSHALQHYLGLL